MSNIRVFKSDMNEYLHSQSLGYAVRTRVEYSVNNGLLVYSNELGD